MTEPLRIAFFSEHASPVALLGGVDAGGQNVYVDEVSRQLARLDHTVDVFTRRDDPDAPEVLGWAPGVRVVNVTAGPAEPVFKDHLWPLMPEFLDACLRFLGREPTPYDVVHGNFWMSGWAAVQLKRRFGVPAVHIFHATGKTKRRHQGNADTSPDERIEVELEVVRSADRLIAQCPAEQVELVEDYEADPVKVSVIPSAVNVETFRPTDRAEARRRLGLDPDALVVVYVGRMLPRKDVRNLLRAAALLIHSYHLPVTLLLVGGESVEPDPAATPEIGVLQHLAGDLGIVERVHFAGKRQPDVLRYFYAAGDVAVTTPWYEPFGLTPLEAMACARPVVGSRVGGISYTVQDGVTGFLVPPRDPHALAARLHEILIRPELGRQMGEAARRRVEREFTWPVVARRTAALYADVLRSGAPASAPAAGGRR